MNKQTAISIGIIVIAVIGALVVLQRADNKPGKLDSFAACLGDNGATFFGAFWCPHCADQKKMFGQSVQYLPYTECSTPDSKGQTQVCIDAGVQSYPTWQFTDGSRLNGVLPLETLAEKTGCVLPDSSSNPNTETSIDLGESSNAAVTPIPDDQLNN